MESVHIFIAPVALSVFIVVTFIWRFCFLVISTETTQASHCVRLIVNWAYRLDWTGYTSIKSNANLVYLEKDRPQTNLCGFESRIIHMVSTANKNTIKTHHILYMSMQTMKWKFCFNCLSRKTIVMVFGIAYLCMHSCLSVVCRGCCHVVRVWAHKKPHICRFAHMHLHIDVHNERTKSIRLSHYGNYCRGWDVSKVMVCAHYS